MQFFFLLFPIVLTCPNVRNELKATIHCGFARAREHSCLQLNASTSRHILNFTSKNHNNKKKKIKRAFACDSALPPSNGERPIRRRIYASTTLLLYIEYYLFFSCISCVARYCLRLALTIYIHTKKEKQIFLSSCSRTLAHTYIEIRGNEFTFLMNLIWYFHVGMHRTDAVCRFKSNEKIMWNNFGWNKKKEKQKPICSRFYTNAID